MVDEYKSKTKEELADKIIELQSRLDESEQTLSAIQNGEIDAIITPQGSDGPKVYTLESADTLYRNLIQEMGEGIATLTLNGIIFYANAQLASLLKIPLDKIIGLKFIDFILEEDLEVYNTIFKMGLNSKAKGEINIKSADGTIIPIYISINNSKELNGVYIVIADLSEQKHYEELKIAHQELIERENKFRTLFENSMDAILLTIPDGTVLSANPAAEKLFGYSEDEMIKLGRNGLTDTEYPNFKKLLVDREHNDNSKGEIVLIKKDGTRFPAEISANIFKDGYGNKRSTLVIRDITRRKQIEKALKKSERSLDEAQHIAHIGSWEWNIKTHNINWSRELYSIYGVDPDNFTPRVDSFSNFVHPEDRDYVNQNIDELTSNGEGRDFDFRIILDDGSIRVLNTLAEVAEFDENGKPSIIIGTNQDITERKEIEVKLSENIRNLARSNQELEQFAYVASHDLREPLRMITSFLQLLERRYSEQLDKDATEFIEYAVNGAKRLDNMIKDLLQYSQVTRKEVNFLPVSIELILEQTLINLKVPIDENKAIITHGTLPIIKGDAELLVLLFQNLISNSIKYRSDKTPKIDITARKEDHQYLFSVTDNGIGMSTKYLERIFTIFQRLHTMDEFDGTGIGLAIAQKIVHLHNGQIWVESGLGKGSTFYFTIPYRDESEYTDYF
jgi:PAS domain S-box-containing protein